MVQLSFTPILTKMRIDLKSCNYLALSLRWIATVKIKILPQINSLFSMISFKPTSKWFQSLKCDFYWKNTKARISLSTLYVINVINVCWNVIKKKKIFNLTIMSMFRITIHQSYATVEGRIGIGLVLYLWICKMQITLCNGSVIFTLYCCCKIFCAFLCVILIHK